jgi:hypothetical protein
MAADLKEDGKLQREERRRKDDIQNLLSNGLFKRTIRFLIGEFRRIILTDEGFEEVE